MVGIDVEVLIDSNLRKKEGEKLEQHQGLKEEVERMLKGQMDPGISAALGARAPKLMIPTLKTECFTMEQYTYNTDNPPSRIG